MSEILTPQQITSLTKDVFTKYRVKSAYVFGSSARQQMNTNSDIDILVNLNSGAGLFALGELKYQLEDKLLHKVDLFTPSLLRPSILAQVEQEKISIYEQK